MPVIQKHFEFTQRIITSPIINGRKHMTIHGELFINGEGYYDGETYDYDLNGVYFFPQDKGSFTTNSINLLALLQHLGVDPKEDERIKYPVLAHLDWLYLPEVAQAFNEQAMTDSREGVKAHFRIYEPPELLNNTEELINTY